MINPEKCFTKLWDCGPYILLHYLIMVCVLGRRKEEGRYICPSLKNFCLF